MTLVDNIESRLARRFNKRYCILTGSGTTALYLLLKSLDLIAEDSVLLPGTCCFAPAYAVKYAGLRLDFCDVSLQDGCLTPESLESALNRNSSIRAVIGVHLYGNLLDMDPIAEICRKRNITFIEDACQAYGSEYYGSLCGSLGDVSILSFGHTKVLDAGGTGLFLTDNPELATRVREGLKKLAAYDSSLYISLSKKHSEEYYTLMKRAGNDNSLKASFGRLYQEYRDLFIHGINSDTLLELSQLIDRGHEIIAHRIKLGKLYMELLHDCSEVMPLISGHDPVFWRFSFLIKGADTARICGEIRKNGYDVSSWYPNLANMFIQDYVRDLANSNILEQQVVNLWVDETKDENYVHNISSLLKNLISSNRSTSQKEELYHVN